MVYSHVAVLQAYALSSLPSSACLSFCSAFGPPRKMLFHLAAYLLLLLQCTSASFLLNFGHGERLGAARGLKERDRPAATLAQRSSGGPNQTYAWPEKWQSKWILYHVFHDKPEPAYPNGQLIYPYTASLGGAYYDWTNKRMLEFYEELCAPIFVNGSDFSCHFLNVDETSYMISFADRPHWVPECCIFGKPWYPPAPDFVPTVLNYTGTQNFHNKEAAFFRRTFSDGLTFGYVFYEETGEPAEFYANALPGWMVQDYYDFEKVTPPESVWTLPDACKEAKVCDLPH